MGAWAHLALIWVLLSTSEHYSWLVHTWKSNLPPKINFVILFQFLLSMITKQVPQFRRIPILTRKTMFMIYFGIHLGSDTKALNFSLSLCNPLKYIWLPYIIWKGRYIDIIWGSVACSPPRDYRNMASWNFQVKQPLYRSWSLLS